MAKQKVKLFLGKPAAGGPASASYPVFEPNQVLTAGNLNTLADYINQGERQARAALDGAGIFDGLTVWREDNEIIVGRGFGVTTDGDLLMQPADARHAAYKPYGLDADTPQYDPFMDPGNPGSPRPLYELIPPERESEDFVEKLADFPRDINTMAVLMYVESYENDPDLCTSTDCDNLGRTAVFNIRFLLASAQDAREIRSALADPGRLEKLTLPLLRIGRPRLDDTLKTTQALRNRFYAQCLQAHQLIATNNPPALAAIAGLFQAAPGLFHPHFHADPSGGWQAKLKAPAQQDGNIQYHYDFLKDFVETWNALREAVLQDEALFFPAPSAFPKHLILGNLMDSPALQTGFEPSPQESLKAAARLRTPFYPAPTEACGREARALLWKLHVLVNCFSPPTPGAAIKITAGGDETRPLAERAVPFYYADQAGLSAPAAWNCRLARAGLEGADFPSAEWDGAAATQGLQGQQLGRHRFFRVEGHLGQAVDPAVTGIKKLIEANNLPFDVQAVLLPDIFVLPDWPDWRDWLHLPLRRYTDLHRFHKLVRQDVAGTLDAGKTQAAQLRGAIWQGIQNEDIDPENGNAIKKADEARNQIALGVQQSMSVLGAGSYAEYKQQADTPQWPNAYTQAVKSASQFKYDFGTVLRNDHPTMLDTLTIDSRFLWLDWLDQLIEDQSRADNEKRLFHNFIARHPGLEHLGGAPRGGTFVLVYNKSKSVVADFCLPYQSQERHDPLPDQEFKFTPPKIILPDLFPWALNVVRTVEWQVRDFNAQYIKPEWKKAVRSQKAMFKLQDSYFSKLQDYSMKSLDIYTNALAGGTGAAGGGNWAGGGFFSWLRRLFSCGDDSAVVMRRSAAAQPAAGAAPTADGRASCQDAENVERARLWIDVLQNMLLEPDLPEQASARLRAKLAAAQDGMAEDAAKAAEYVAASRTSVEPGSEGERVLKTVAAAALELQGTPAGRALGQRLQALQASLAGIDPLKPLLAALLAKDAAANG